MKLSIVRLASFAACLAVLNACATETQLSDEDAVDDVSAVESALTGTVTTGAQARTTGNLRLRAAASTSSSTLRVLPKGTIVTLLSTSASNGFYKVSEGGNEGYSHGAFLEFVGGSNSATPSGSSSGSSNGTPPSSAGQSGSSQGGTPGGAVGDSFVSKGTGYYPDSSALEGGFVDRKGAPLRTLQQYLAGQASYVSVAMDTKAFPYGQKLRIKELELKYNQVIEFRVVDTGGAFQGRGRSRIDVCVKNHSASIDSTINGTLHITAVP
jgi:3D (Asp-Asp-Asp) domain-containing protein